MLRNNNTTLRPSRQSPAEHAESLKRGVYALHYGETGCSGSDKLRKEISAGWQVAAVQLMAG